MSVPTFDYDRVNIAGDPNDDDAEVINSLVQSDAEPPPTDELPLEPISTGEKPKTFTRMETGSMVPMFAWGPVQLLQENPGRISLRIDVQDVTATESIRIADDPGKLNSLMTCHRMYVGQVFSEPHSGPVWVMVSADDNDTEVLTVTWAATNKQ